MTIETEIVLDIVLFVFLTVSAIAVIRMRDLVAAAMLTGIFSLLSAGLYTVMDAVDVAFTEASVGAGIATVLILGALSLMNHQEKPTEAHPWLALVVTGLTGAALIYGTLDMPEIGDPTNPIHQHVAPRYIASVEEVEIPNMVTSVLASYRGYDTFGETTVVLTAGIGVLLLLRTRRRREGAEEPA